MLVTAVRQGFSALFGYAAFTGLVKGLGYFVVVPHQVSTVGFSLAAGAVSFLIGELVFHYLRNNRHSI